jgi:hypothetical protein
MTRTEAQAIARQQYAAYISADIEHLFRGAPAPVGADYGYRHGWVAVGEFNFRSDEISDGAEQPYMD